MTRLAFEFLILTVARTGEVIGGQRSEIDRREKLWVIPAERMKGNREHRVPLVPRMLDILDRANGLAPGSLFLFAGRSGKAGLSNMVFLMTLRRMGVSATVHGFRSSFADWASEETNHPREVCEQAQAHAIKNRVEAAYRRGDLLGKRRLLMRDWAAFVDPFEKFRRAVEL